MRKLPDRDEQNQKNNPERDPGNSARGKRGRTPDEQASGDSDGFPINKGRKGRKDGPSNDQGHTSFRSVDSVLVVVDPSVRRSLPAEFEGLGF